jgi:hypothetical protein
MPRQVVVSCRMPPSGVVTRGAQSYLERARALARRAEALGAQLVSWSATTLAFAWDPESVEEAVALAVSAREDALFAGSMWACGIAEGEMEPLSVAVQRADLAWGEPLVRAVSLARIAEPGQVLLDDSLGAFQRGELHTKGRRMGKDAGEQVHGEELDTQAPWIRAGVPSSSSFASEKAPEVRPALVDPDAAADDPEVFAARMVDLTREALVAGNAKNLQRLSEGLRATGEHEVLADRMRAMARLSRGQVGEALRALRQTRMLSEAEPASVRCQAALALAFALSLSGRPDDALLEGLDALARAREGEDRKAQGACLAFLAKLFTRVGDKNGAARITEALASYPRTPSFTSIPSQSQ